MRRGSRKNLHRLLVSRTFFQAQAWLLLLERGEKLKDLGVIAESATAFLDRFFPSCVVRCLISLVSPRMLDRAGINFRLEHARGRMVFRNVAAIFENDQE